MAERILSFKELRVYQLAFELQEIFETSKRFPAEGTLRADGSNPTSIAIHWSKYIGGLAKTTLYCSSCQQADRRRWRRGRNTALVG
jgi:hypothetical protein